MSNRHHMIMVPLEAAALAQEYIPDVSAPCDGLDHGASGHLHALIDDAYNFNQLLKANQADGSGKGNAQAVENAAESFYKELTEAPVGERRILLSLAQSYNQAEAKGDPAMPTISSKVYSDAFLEQFSIRYPYPVKADAKNPADYAAEFFEFQDRGMCALSAGISGPYSSTTPSFEIILPSLNMRP